MWLEATFSLLCVYHKKMYPLNRIQCGQMHRTLLGERSERASISSIQWKSVIYIANSASKAKLTNRRDSLKF